MNRERTAVSTTNTITGHNTDIKNTESERKFLIEFLTKNINTCKNTFSKKLKTFLLAKDLRIKLYCICKSLMK